MKNNKVKKQIHREKKRQRLLPNILLAVFSVPMFFAIVELLLTLGNIENPKEEDPFIGFEAIYPLFSKVEIGTETYFQTSKNKLTHFNYQRFSLKKRENTFRIFCLGGSSTFGRPYDGTTAFSAWLQQFLEKTYPGKNFEVINTGGISYASYRLVDIVREVSDYSPDLFILYAGHNEYLEARTYEKLIEENPAIRSIRKFFHQFRFYNLLENQINQAMGTEKAQQEGQDKTVLKSEENAMLNVEEGLSQYHKDPDWITQVAEHFDYSLSQIVQIAENNNVPLFISSMPSNILDFSPFKSEYEKTMPFERQRKIASIISQVQKFLDQNKPEKAFPLIEEGLRIDPEFATLLYLKGKALYLQKKYSSAKKVLSMARDMDVCPLRATSLINEIIEGVANSNDIPLLDIKGEFESKSVGQIPGYNLFTDHVHPTLEGHRMIAEVIVQTMVSEEIIPPVLTPISQTMDAVEKKISVKIDGKALGTKNLNEAKVLGWAKKYTEAIPYLKEALSHLPKSFEANYLMGFYFSQLEMKSEALAYYQKANSINSELCHVHRNIGAIYLKMGKSESALKEFTRALQLVSDDYLTLVQLGILWIEAENYEKAQEYLESAIRIYNDSPKAHTVLGALFGRRGNDQLAMREYQIAIALNSEDDLVHNNLGMIYLSQKKYELAQTEFQDAIILNPENEKAHNNLGLVFQVKGDAKNALYHFQVAYKINPDNARTYLNIAVTLSMSHAPMEEVISMLQASLGLNPDFVDARILLGNIYYANKRKKLASEQYAIALKLQPTNTQLSERIISQ